MIEQLRELPPMQPDARAVDRVRRRCHAALTRPEPAPAARHLEGVLFAAAAVYLLSAFMHLWQFFRA